MKVLISVLALVAVAAAEFKFTEEWELWKKKHGKDYGSEEEELSRRIVWESNKNYVDNHNAHADVYGFTLAMNKFADMESSEFGRMFNGYQSRPVTDLTAGEPYVPTMSFEDLPKSVDWRQKGYVTNVKNQGQCGSCWAFSATGSLEGQHFNATGKLVSLSEQNLMDCSWKEGDESCSGGLMDNAFKYIIKNGGIDTEESYPYKAHDEKKCRFKKADIGATMSSYRDVKSKSESDLQAAVGTVGPISVAIDASHTSFQLYDGGVYYERRCSQTQLDHGVLAVGYGTDEENNDYWIVKNSWDKSWGQEGYVLMARNQDNNCGIATSASFPIV